MAATNGSIFGAMLQEFDGAARILNLEPDIWKILTHPKRQITVSCPIQMDNGEIEVFTGYRVQYNITLGPAKGGIRYHPGVTLDGVTALAARMTWQSAVAHIPFGGGKGGVICDPTKMSKREIEALTRRYVAEIVDAIGPEKDVPAPDVNTNAQIMAWVMDTYSMHVGHTTTSVVTGKPVELGGSLGRREATGRGLMIATRESARHVGFDIKGATVAIQGFGNVGSVSADLLMREAGANIAGVTTSYFEWVQDRYGYFWTEKEVNERLEAKMCEAFGAVLQTSLKYKVDMRTAAYIVAINRVAIVTRMRGMYA